MTSTMRTLLCFGLLLVTAAAKLLSGAKRPVLLMGRCSRSLDGWKQRVALAEKLSAPVLTNIKTAAAFPTDHRLHVRAPATAPWRVAASRSHRDARTEAFIANMGEVEPVGLGSSLKFCRLADGGLDIYPRFGPTSEWDTAAGQCVLEGAGGAVIDPHGRPFRYNQRERILNGER